MEHTNEQLKQEMINILPNKLIGYMKPAQEWSKDFHVAAHSQIYTEKKIKEIQLDAITEGLKIAEEIANLGAKSVMRGDNPELACKAIACTIRFKSYTLNIDTI